MPRALRRTTLIAVLALTACTSTPAPSTTTTTLAAPAIVTTTPAPVTTADTPTPAPSTTSDTPSATPTPTPTTTTPSAPAVKTVKDVAWDSALLPILCGGPVEMVQLRKGLGRTKLGLVVGYLGVAYGSVTGAAGDDIAVVQLNCVGAHPGPVDAPVFRSGAGGPEFVGFATLSLDRYRAPATVRASGITIRGLGFSDKAPGCCPDLDASMVSTIHGDAMTLQGRDTVPRKGAPKGATECDVLAQIDAQITDLHRQTQGKDPATAAALGRAIPIDALTPSRAAPRALWLLETVQAITQRGCP